MLNVDSFRKQLATESVDEYLSYLLNVYIDSQEFDTLDGKEFITLFDKDASSAGMINFEDYKKFIDGTVYKNFLADRKYAKQFLALTSDEERTAFLSKVQDEMHSLVSVPGYVMFDTSLLRGDGLLEMEHEFDINVDAKDIYEVMASIYNAARANDVNIFLSTRKIVGDIKEGHSDAISIGATTPELDSVLRVLGTLPENIMAKMKKPCQYGAVIDGWLGYNSIDLERKESARSLVGKAFIETIDNAIRSLALEAEDFKAFADALENGAEKDKVRTNALRVIREVYPDVYGNLVNNMKETISLYGIKPEYLFVAETVSIALHNTYGSIIAENVSDEVEEVPAENVDDIPTINVEDLLDSQEDFSPVTPEETVEVKDVLDGTVEIDPSVGVVTTVEEPAELTESEIDAMVEAAVSQDIVEAQEVEVTEANRAAYIEIGVSEELLDSPVRDQAGRAMTLYEYLERNNTLEKIPADASVTLATDVSAYESGSVMTGASFISNVIVQYAVKLGEVSVDDLIEKYSTSITMEEVKKPSFLGKLFGAKK